MSDTTGDGTSAEDVEIEVLAAARGRTDAEFKELYERVAARHRTAVLSLQHSLLQHERWVADQALDRLRHLTKHYERLSPIQEARVESLNQHVQLWKEEARRLGADVDDEVPAPQRRH